MYSASSIIQTSIISTLAHPDTITSRFSGKGHIVRKREVGNGRHPNFKAR